MCCTCVRRRLNNCFDNLEPDSGAEKGIPGKLTPIYEKDLKIVTECETFTL